MALLNLPNQSIFYQNFAYTYTKTEEQQEGTTYQTVVYTSLVSGLDYGKWYTYQIQDVTADYSIKPIKFRLASPYLTNTTFSTEDGSLINKTQTNKIIIMGNLDSYDRGMSTIQTTGYSVMKAGDQFAGVIQIGNIVNNVEDSYGAKAEEYFNDLQDLASITPLVVTSGKKENFEKYSFFDLRIRNPLFNQTNNRYFSYNLQGIHFVAIDFDFYDRSTAEAQSQIYSWIENDLKLANDTNARKLWPFVVILSSQSIYCIDSPLDADEGTGCGDYYYKRMKWDSLFFDYNVDMMISASEISYQRMWPVYKNEARDYYTYDDGTGENYILNPPSTVYINEGIGGFGAEHVPDYDPSDFAEIIDTEPGFGVLYLTNSSSDVRLTYDHYRSGKGGAKEKLIDTVTLVRTRNEDGTLTEPQTNNTSKLPTILKIAIPSGILIVGIIIAVICKRRKQRLEIALMNDSNITL